MATLEREERRGGKKRAPILWSAADDVAAEAAEGRLFVDHGGRACCIAAQRERTSEIAHQSRNVSQRAD